VCLYRAPAPRSFCPALADQPAPTINQLVTSIPTANRPQQTVEAFLYYYLVFFETIAFYTIFGQFLVWSTSSPAIAQVGSGL
jgi:hypothetical protein